MLRDNIYIKKHKILIIKTERIHFLKKMSVNLGISFISA